MTKHLGVFGRLLDEFMKFLVKYSGRIEKLAERFRAGKLVESDGRTVFQPSRRVITTALGTQAGAPCC